MRPIQTQTKECLQCSKSLPSQKFYFCSVKCSRKYKYNEFYGKKNLKMPVKFCKKCGARVLTLGSRLCDRCVGKVGTPGCCRDCFFSASKPCSDAFYCYITDGDSVEVQHDDYCEYFKKKQLLVEADDDV